VALVAAVSWNVTARRAASDGREQVRILEERIESAGSMPAVARPDKAERPDPNSSTARKIPTTMTAEMRDVGEEGGRRELKRFQKRLPGMGKEELVAALAEIAALGLSPAEQAELEKMLAEPLIEMDPQLALTTFADRLADDDDGVQWQLPTALGAWAANDPAAAAAWLDARIAAGVFESKSLDGLSQARLEFEAALTGALLASDAAAAGRRIDALPEEQRREALGQIAFSELNPAGQKAYVELARTRVPRDEQASTFTHVICELLPDGGYAGITVFLDGIQATSEERAISARAAAGFQLGGIADERAVTRADVDVLRKWVDSQTPGAADRVTGESLAEAVRDGGEFGFTEASRLVLEYHKSSGHDEVLAAFLESLVDRSHQDEALTLTNKITDPKRRDEVLKQLNEADP
jgi:hypothetical protein